MQEDPEDGAEGLGETDVLLVEEPTTAALIHEIPPTLAGNEGKSIGAAPNKVKMDPVQQVKGGRQGGTVLAVVTI